jgi:hypothetical protein
MRRARLLIALVGAAGIAYACGFPDVEFGAADGGPAEASTSSSTSSSGTTSSTSSSGTAEIDSGVILDAGEIQVIIDGSTYDASFDAGSKVDASAGCFTCDCDGDGFLNDDAGCNPPPDKLDCDDLDSRTHPGAGPYSFPAEPPRNGDWNCTNGVEKIPPDEFQCGDVASALVVGGCAAAGGFVDTVECGAKGTYVTCKDPFLGVGNCATDKVGTATQLCQ